MLRATVWTVGLFGAGTAISRLFPGTWTEPLVLLGLGIALLFVSARTARTTTVRGAKAAPGRAARPVAAATRVAAHVAAKPVAAAAAATLQGTTVEVERTA